MPGRPGSRSPQYRLEIEWDNQHTNLSTIPSSPRRDAVRAIDRIELHFIFRTHCTAASWRPEIVANDPEPAFGFSRLNQILQVLETAATRFQNGLHFTKGGGIFRQRDRGVEMVNAMMFHAED